MNRKDFELVARVVKNETVGDPTRRFNVARAFALAIAGAENCSGFDRAKFLKQCGVA